VGEVSYSVRGLQKEFAGRYAVEDATFDVEYGSIHGVIGKNGAGKSVLMNMIAGTLEPSGGELSVGGQHVADHKRWSARAAQKLGVALIPQEPPSLPYLTVEDYLFLGDRTASSYGVLNLRAMRAKVAEIDERLNLQVAPTDAMVSLPIEVQQLLAFGKAIFLEKARVVLLDEITASLSGARREGLLRQLRELAVDRSFTLITHHIGEVIAACDRVTVMRDGVSVDTLDVADATPHILASKIVGEMGVTRTDGGGARDLGREVIELRGLTSLPAFEGVSLAVHEHEVVGIAGVEGSGKDELLGSLAGLRRATGEVRMNGSHRAIRSPRAATRAGIAYLPKKREEYATIHNLSVLENLLLPVAGRFAGPLGLLRESRLRRTAATAVEQMDVKPRRTEAIINTLSGGNRQKVMIGRLRQMTPRLYLLNEPTRGVDIATKPELLRVIRSELTAGSGVIMTSESEEELVDTCDRVLIFVRGRIVREIARDDPAFNVGEIYRTSQGVERT
jgi:ABC-type sugar transport system ATPase subunit